MSFRSLGFALALAAMICSAGAAQAQIAPGDTGAGVQLGMLEQNNSGQVGDVTLFPRGNSTLVVIHVHSEPAGHREPAHIHRGQDTMCADINPKPYIVLADVVNGTSRTLVQMPIARLLSGNYDVNVHISAKDIPHYVSCGHLYR
jgi:hypothetical protein